MLRSRQAAWAAVAVAMTLVAVLLYANLASPDQQIERPVPHLYGVHDAQFRRTMDRLMGPQFLPGNRVTALINGDEAFPAMLAAIRSARQSIDLESYIFWSGEIATQFADALAERARAGVPVHVVVDWLGSKKIDDELVKRMRRAGVVVVKYRPLRWYTLARFNNRTHRKLLIVDGRVGFTGGIGVADLYRGHAQDEEHWRDSQFRIEGPAVSELQAVFLDNWVETDNPLLDGPAYFPALDSVGPELAQAVLSSPGGGTEGLRLMFLIAIASAERSIRIANAYFVPNTLAVDMLVAARRRGVDVEIIVPGPVNDAKLVDRASHAKWGPLLEAGVKIYQYQPTMYHTKVTVVDDYWVSVGSTNFDNRSFRLNDEANLNVLDDAFGRAQGEVFERDRARAREVTLDAWRHRPLMERLEELVGRMVRHQL
ncbi:MAG: phospholipase D-like domain-containing protein [Gemmatimonadales bacterium]